MKHKILIVTIIAIALTTAYCLVPEKISNTPIKIKCNYMAYACGDCYPQYKVNEILEGGSEEVNKILNTEIIVKFEDKKMEQKLDKSTAKCVICYNFTFTGDLKHSSKNGTYLIAKTAEYKLKNDSCCK
jgi:hypothetical protein